LKNTYSKRLEEFVPHDPSGQVTLYSCGPTVYSHNHIGNFRSFLLADVLRRTLEQRGYAVRHVMNITDVGHMTEDHLADANGEDKLAKAARELSWNPYQVAAHFEQSFVEDAQALRLKNYVGPDASDPELHPRATEHIPEMLAMIQKLLDRGHAYTDPIGQVYFDVNSFPEYGRLSGKVLDELEAGARICVRAEKRDPRDFALWKVDPKHLMCWDPHRAEGWRPGEFERLQRLVRGHISPSIRAGFPGWHLECSAMSRVRLAPLIDLHTGGEDNIFPHHECEIAQSYGAREDDVTAGNFARYWVHARHLLVNGAKMSKRDGTLITIKSLLNPVSAGPMQLTDELKRAGFAGGTVPPSVLRFALIATPFTQPMNFTVDVLMQAKAGVERLQSLYTRLEQVRSGGELSAEVRALVELGTTQFDAALDDNLNMSQALAATFKVVSAANRRDLTAADARALRGFLEHCNAIYAVLDHAADGGYLSKDELETGAARPLSTPATVPQLLAARFAAKRDSDFLRADSLREQLRACGIELEDTHDGVRWSRR
jgi:cysteinyl-tRNA synthetase